MIYASATIQISNSFLNILNKQALIVPYLKNTKIKVINSRSYKIIEKNSKNSSGTSEGWGSPLKSGRKQQLLILFLSRSKGSSRW